MFHSIGSIKAVLLFLATCSSAANSPGSPHCNHTTRCPTWFVPDNTGTRCECGSAVAGVVCYQGSNKTVLYARRCVTFDDSAKVATAGLCPYNKQNSLFGTTELPQNVTQLNRFMCGGLNRMGVLCSHCVPGLGPPLLSYELKCLKRLDGASGWLLFIFLACVPSTVLFFILLFFQVRVTSAPMNCFILFAQVYNFLIVQTQPLIAHGPVGSLKIALAKILETLYGFWMLDFFRLVIPPFCAGSSTTMIHVLALEYIVALYPLVLVVLIYFCVQKYVKGSPVLACLWEPCRVCFVQVQRVWNPSRSLVQAFASCLVLAYCKIMTISATLLRFTTLHNECGIPVDQSKMTYYNASVPYFGSEHAPLGILAVLMIVVFNLLPMVFLFLYPTQIFQSCLNCCKIRSHTLHVFAHAFNGCYKNGCGGTRDHRWFAGFYMLFRMALVTLEFIRSIKLYMTLCCAATGFLLLLVRPYKDDFFSYLDFFVLLSAGLAGTAAIVVEEEKGGFVSPTVSLVAVIPALYFAFYVTARVVLCARILDKLRCCQKLKRLLERATADFGEPRWQNGSGTAQGRSLITTCSSRYGAISPLKH